MRNTIVISLVFFALFSYGLFISQFNVQVIEEQLEPKNAPGFYDYRGATHVHTNRALGSGSPIEVIAAAQEAGLDFVFLTDLNVFNRDFGIEGYHRKLLVLVAGAYSYLDSRILSYDIVERHSLDSLGQAQVLLADLLSQSGSDADEDLLVLAHPFKTGYSWSGPFPSGLDGLEIINLKSVWQRAWSDSRLSFIWSALIYPFNSQLALLRLYQDPQPELRLWDSLNQGQRAIGFAGTEATARTGSVGNFHFKFPAYQVSFGLLSNHVLLRSEFVGDPESDRRKLLEALHGGQFYMSLDILGNPKGFAAFLQDGERVHPMGSEVAWRPGMKLMVRLPQKPRVPFETVFFKDGEHVMSSNSLETEYDLHGPGAYRVTVRVSPTLPLPDGKRWIPWIYSNPFFIRAAEKSQRVPQSAAAKGVKAGKKAGRRARR